MKKFRILFQTTVEEEEQFAAYERAENIMASNSDKIEILEVQEVEFEETIKPDLPQTYDESAMD